MPNGRASSNYPAANAALSGDASIVSQNDKSRQHVFAHLEERFEIKSLMILQDPGHYPGELRQIACSQGKSAGQNPEVTLSKSGNP